MTITVAERLSSAFTDTTLPILYRDPILNSGSMFLYDLSNSYCWNPSASITNGASVPNLLDGAPAATLISPAGAPLTFVSGKGMQLYTSGLSYSGLELDTGTNYFQTNLSHDMMIFTWIRYPASDAGGGSEAGMCFAKANINNYSSMVGPFLATRITGSGSNPDATFKLDSTTSYNGISATGLSNPESSAVLWAIAKIGTSGYIYRNGVSLGSGSLGSTALAANSNPMTWGSNISAGYAIPGIILERIGAEDLTTSAAAAGVTTLVQFQNQVAAEYAANSSRF